jgi:hypothetical protein
VCVILKIVASTQEQRPNQNILQLVRNIYISLMEFRITQLPKEKDDLYNMMKHLIYGNF